MSLNIQRIYRFNNANDIINNNLDDEIQNIADLINNFGAGLLSWDRANLTVRVVTAAGAITASTETILAVNKTVGAATALTLTSTPIKGFIYIVKDAKGDANTNNITISPASGTIDGASNKVISTAYGIQRLFYNGTEWNTW